MQNSKEPQISVVLPTYNRAQTYLTHAIQSICDQTFDNWELIIVDDGSTDNTKELVACYSKKQKRIRYFKNKKNRGISYTRNFGNSKARGELIVIQDSDDMSLPDRLQEIWDYHKANPTVDVIYHSFYIRAIDITYGQRGIHREYYRSAPYDREKAIIVPYIPGFVAYKREIAEIPYREAVKHWDDWMFIIDCTMKNKKFGFIDKPLYEYVISDDSVTTNSTRNGSREMDQQAMQNIMVKEHGFTFK